jgi:hypothetical protein
VFEGINEGARGDDPRNLQVELFSLPDGFRLEFKLGRLSLGVHATPAQITIERWEEKIWLPLNEVKVELEQALEIARATYGEGTDGFFAASEELRVFDRALGLIQNNWRVGPSGIHPVTGEAFDNSHLMIRRSQVIESIPIREAVIMAFNYIDYSFEDLLEDYELAEYAVEINRPQHFTFNINFLLDGPNLRVNIPVDEIISHGGEAMQVGDESNVRRSTPNPNVNQNLRGARPQYPQVPLNIELMKFFGAGGTRDEGYIFVPSGSGAIINFNNGKSLEDAYNATVYGFDYLMFDTFAQNVHNVRMPVYGIKNGDAAFVAHIEHGAALATISAEVAGRTNSYNKAWFNFNLREHRSLSMVGMPTVDESDLTAVQEYSYDGDISVVYSFLAGDNPGYVEMAHAYQQELVRRGILTPITERGDTSLYIDIIGSVDKRRFFLGIPYWSQEVMTTYAETNTILDRFADAGIHAIQMQLHGWFNRGINHDVAKNINLIRRVGTQAELSALGRRLQQSGGGLYPAVNFQITSINSRNINRSFEIAKDPGGTLGITTSLDREALSTFVPWFRHEIYQIISPTVLPYHIDQFIPAFNRRTGLGGLALTDLGSILSQSIYRRYYADREHSRLIAAEQIERLSEEYTLLIAGGNDYAWRGATHLVDIPTETDWFYVIDYEVPFIQLVLHSFVEYTGSAINTREVYNERAMFLTMLATGTAPRYMLSGEPLRRAEFTPYEHFYSTDYTIWFDTVVHNYLHYNDVYKHLRTERMTDHKILRGGTFNTAGSNQVTMTEFANGTRIYVNTTQAPYTIPDARILMPNEFLIMYNQPVRTEVGGR